MENNWIKCKLGDIVEVGGGGTPKTKVKEYWNGDIEWLTPTDVTAFEGRFISNTARKITNFGLDNSSAKLYDKGTLMMTSRATIGYVVINSVPMATNQGFINIKCGESVYALFLLYWIKNNKKYIENMATGTTFREISKRVFKEINIDLPSLKEQKKIALLLSSFDNRIELNNEMNKTLEEMAQAIFKSWFVDFEPFKDGEFEESELGLIPKGWKVKTLKDICQINMGQSPSSETYNNENNGVPFYQGVKDFKERFPLVTMYCSEPKKVAEQGDILLSVRAPVGSLNIAVETCCIGRGVASIKSELYGNSFVYYLLKNIKWDRYESGTVFTSIKKSDIENYKIIVPSIDFVEKFNKLIKSLDYKIYNSSMEIIELQKIRDTLLPKLISGEIRL